MLAEDKERKKKEKVEMKLRESRENEERMESDPRFRERGNAKKE